MTTKELVKKIFFIEILKGLALTLSRLFSHAVTIQYPKERRPIAPGFRGQHALVRDSETGKCKCVGCGLCVAYCPSKCIHVFTVEGEEGAKIVERYEIEVLRCIYCGFCVEACPYGAISLTENYEYSDYSREALYMTKEKLLSNWDKYMAGKKGEYYFKKFWRPMSEDLGTPPGQAVFRGKHS
ncbi:MAG: NADH-quinone oxidoreductase subunit NuoI [Nitrospirota bacterium]